MVYLTSIVFILYEINILSYEINSLSNKPSR